MLYKTYDQIDWIILHNFPVAMVIQKKKLGITYGTKEQQLWALVSVLQQFFWVSKAFISDWRRWLCIDDR